MRFFSKIVTLCNIAFLIAAVLRIIKFTSTVKANPNTVQQTNFFVGTVLILAIVAVLLNTIFVTIILILRLQKKEVNIHKILVYGNVLIFPLQMWYYFFS